MVCPSDQNLFCNIYSSNLTSSKISYYEMCQNDVITLYKEHAFYYHLFIWFKLYLDEVKMHKIVFKVNFYLDNVSYGSNGPYLIKTVSIECFCHCNKVACFANYFSWLKI